MGTRTPVVEHAEGVYLYDTDGRQWLDGCSGAVNVNIGHGVPEVLESMRAQAEHVCFVYRTQFSSPAVQQLRTELARLAPPGLNHVEFTNSGSEAVETALRAAIAYHRRRGATQRTVILSESPSYHGMTAGALDTSGHPLRRQNAGALLAGAGVLVGHRDKHRGGRADLADWLTAIDAVGADRVAALVIETVGGASCGAIPLPPDTLRALAAACRERDILLVADEVMTGLGRTGRWFGCDHAGVVPDLLALGKGLSSGYTPMAATFIHDRLLPAFDGRPEAVCFGHTMAGNPLSASVALAVLRYHQVHGLPSRAAVAGAHLARELRLLAKQHPVITEVRGQGLLLGLGLRAGATAANPLDTAQRLVAAAQAERLVLYPSGVDAGTQSVLVAPPLTITNTEISDLVARLRRALRRLDATSVRPQDARSAVA